MKFLNFLARILIKIIRILPHGCAVKLGGFLGRLIWLFSWSKVNVCESRCVMALGVGVSIAREIIFKFYVNLGRSLAEFIRLDILKNNKKNKKYSLENLVEIYNLNIVNKALSRNKGVIFMLAHMGNWELAAERMTHEGYEITAIYTDQNNRGGANDFILRQRKEAAEMQLIPAKGAGLREAFKTLKNNKILCIFQDLDARKNGVDIKFMNMPASAHDGLIKFYNKLKSPVIPVLCVRGEDKNNFLKHKIIFYDILSDKLDANGREFGKDLSASLKMCNDVIENWVREYPAQWMWTLDRWGSKLRVKKAKKAKKK